MRSQTYVWWVVGAAGLFAAVSLLLSILSAVVLHQPASDPAATTPTTAGGGGNNNNLCPTGGLYAPVSQQCAKHAALDVSTTALTSAPTLVHLTQWTVSHTNTSATAPLLTVAAGAPAVPNVSLFTVSVQSASAGNVLTAAFTLTLRNTDTCAARIASLLVLLDQAAGRAGNSYGTGGQSFRFWGAAGSENAATAGRCNTPTVAQICAPKQCNVSVPYAGAGSLVPTPAALVPLIVPVAGPHHSSPIIVPVVARFALSDANLTLMRSYATPLTLTVLVTFDACCKTGDSCGIDMDCSGDRETIRTAQVRLPAFPVPSPPASGTGVCAAVTAAEVLPLQTTITGNLNAACTSQATVTAGVPLPAPPPFAGALVRGQLQCTTASCGCTGPAGTSYSTTLTGAVQVLPAVGQTCTHPITGASLITGSSSVSASTTFACAYPAAVDCVVAEWSAWSEVVPCGVGYTPMCTERSARARAIVTAPCHGGAVCPSTFESRDVPCSDACTSTPQCLPLAMCNGVSVCTAAANCTRYPDQATHCVAGVPTPCAGATSSIETSACAATNCTYSGAPSCFTSPCMPLTGCTNVVSCAAYPDAPAHCLVGGASEACPAEASGFTQECSTDCIYPSAPSSVTPGICNVTTCLLPLLATTVPETPDQCVNGVAVTCPTLYNVTSVACPDLCAYDAWSEWSAWDACAPVNGSGGSTCAQNRTRGRTILAACPPSLACLATDAMEYSACTCPIDGATPTPTPTPVPVPTPTPTGPPSLNSTFIPCQTVDDCPAPLGRCNEARCETYNSTTNYCAITGRICNSSDPCSRGYCDENTGACAIAPPRSCDDNDPCTDDACVPDTSDGCLHYPVAPVPHIYCQQRVCVPGTNGATMMQAIDCNAVAPGTVCSYSDPMGQCRPPCTSDPDCAWLDTDASACTTARCIPSTGTCYLDPVICLFPSVCLSNTGNCSATNPCDDYLNLCHDGQTRNTSDCKCYGNPNACVPESVCETVAFNYTTQLCDRTPVDCNDNNTCTYDWPCNPVIGCSNQIQGTCAPIDACHSAACDPVDGCVAGADISSLCRPSVNADPSINYTCNPVVGCQTLAFCDDDDPCTLDTYVYTVETGGACTHDRNILCCTASSPCVEPGALCTYANSSATVGACLADPINVVECAVEGASCRPLSPCALGNGTCVAGRCTLNAYCGVNLAGTCTPTVCTPTGCVTNPAGYASLCDDGNAMTIDVCAPAECAHTPKHCAHCPRQAGIPTNILDLTGCTCT